MELPRFAFKVWQRFTARTFRDPGSHRGGHVPSCGQSQMDLTLTNCERGTCAPDQ